MRLINSELLQELKGVLADVSIRHSDALQGWFDQALGDMVSEQVALLVDTFLDDHWRSFFDLAQEHCDGVVERPDEALRELALRPHP